VKKKGQKPPEDKEEPGEAKAGDDDSKAAEGEPDAKTDEKEAAADSEAEPETGPEDDSGGTDDSGDEDADEKKPAKKKAKSGEEDDEEIDTEKNNPYLKHPFPPKEKSQEGANAPGNLLAEANKLNLTRAEQNVLRLAQDNPKGHFAAFVGTREFRALEKLIKKGLAVQVGGETHREPYTKSTSYGRRRVNMGVRSSTQIMVKLTPEGMAVDLLDESGGPLLPVKAGATRALTGATSTGNIAIAPVPIGAGDGRKFLDRPGKRKKKPRRLSGQLYLLIRH